MPRSGEGNKVFGVYATRCCDAQIVIPEGVTFPQCLKHNATMTEWQNVTEKKPKIFAIQLPPAQKDPAA